MDYNNTAFEFIGSIEKQLGSFFEAYGFHQDVSQRGVFPRIYYRTEQSSDGLVFFLDLFANRDGSCVDPSDVNLPYELWFCCYVKKSQSGQDEPRGVRWRVFDDLELNEIDEETVSTVERWLRDKMEQISPQDVQERSYLNGPIDANLLRRSC